MTNKNQPSHFARNVIANWIAFVFAAVVGFFLSPYIVNQLGTTKYGVWSLLAGLIGYLAILDLGIRQAVSRYVAHHRAANNHEESSSIFSAALVLMAFLSILAILLSMVLAYLAPRIFSIPDSLIGDTRIIVVLGGLTVAVSLFGGVFGGGVSGVERFDVQCGLEILVVAVRTVAIVVALREGYGLVSLACIHLASSVLNCTVYCVAINRLYPEWHLKFRGRLFPHMRTILSFGTTLSLLGALGVMISGTDGAITAAFLPIESVTFLAIAGSLFAYAKELTRALSYVMVPRVGVLTSLGSNRVGDEIVIVAKVATLIAAAVSVIFFLRGGSFISLWMGPAYGTRSWEVLRVLAIALVLDASRSIAINSLLGMARHGVLIPGIALEAACKLLLSISLVQPLGIVGVVLGTVIPGVLMSLVYIPRCLSNVVGVPAKLFLQKAVLSPAMACIPFAMASAAIERFLPATNLAIFFAQVIAILPLVPITAWFLCLTAAERHRVKLGVSKVVGR